MRHFRKTKRKLPINAYILKSTGILLIASNNPKNMLILHPPIGIKISQIESEIKFHILNSTMCLESLPISLTKTKCLN